MTVEWNVRRAPPRWLRSTEIEQLRHFSSPRLQINHKHHINRPRSRDARFISLSCIISFLWRTINSLISALAPPPPLNPIITHPSADFMFFDKFETDSRVFMRERNICSKQAGVGRAWLCLWVELRKKSTFWVVCSWKNVCQQKIFEKNSKIKLEKVCVLK